MPLAHVNGVSLHYEVTGSGDPIVWIAGTGVGGAVWRRSQVPYFARTHTCLTFDLRGVGESSAPAGEYTVATFADDVTALLDELGIRRAHFVGWSLGSAVIQELALGRPELVRSAVLVSTWSSTRRERHLQRWYTARMTCLQEAPRRVFGQFSFWMMSPTIGDQEPELAGQVEEFFAATAGHQPDHAYVSHFRADLGHETRDRLGRIRCPVLVVFGEEDLITLPAYNRTVAREIPGARIRGIPVAGHFLPLERPDQLNAEIDAFLSGQEDAAGGKD